MLGQKTMPPSQTSFPPLRDARKRAPQDSVLLRMRTVIFIGIAGQEVRACAGMTMEYCVHSE